MQYYFLNGKVIGEFICNDIYDFRADDDYAYGIYDIDDDLVLRTCLENGELWDYGKGKPLYGWNISDLVIYDNPRELLDFYKPCNGDCFGHCKYYRGKEENCDKPKITRPPQSWMYVEVEE